jgi:hypothetical protein
LVLPEQSLAAPPGVTRCRWNNLDTLEDERCACRPDLLAPVERIAGRYGSTLLLAFVLAGIAIAGTAFAFLLISEQTPLFGFQEPGYDPSGIAAARGAEIAAMVFLAAFLIGRLGLKAPMRRW